MTFETILERMAAIHKAKNADHAILPEKLDVPGSGSRGEGVFEQGRANNPG